jgi:hypothetical protein
MEEKYDLQPSALAEGFSEEGEEEASTGDEEEETTGNEENDGF